jgi:Immunity protein 53
MTSATTTEALRKLQEWYQAQCDGESEHTYGITIETLDNPGCSVTVQLVDPRLEDKAFLRSSNSSIIRTTGCTARSPIKSSKVLPDRSSSLRL